MTEQPYDGSRLDRIERAIEHLLDVSARHDASLAAVGERTAQNQIHLDALTVMMNAMNANMDRFQQEFQQDLKILLTAQVLLTDRVDKVTEGQKHTDERLNALIQVVDGFYRRQQG